MYIMVYADEGCPHVSITQNPVNGAGFWLLTGHIVCYATICGALPHAAKLTVAGAELG